MMKHFNFNPGITLGFILNISIAMTTTKALAHDGLHTTDVQISGTLEVVISTDAQRTKSTRQNFIIEKSGKRHEIVMRKPMAIPPGTKVRAKGHSKGLNKIEDVVLYASNGGEITASQTLLASPLPAQIGNRKVAVFLVNFQDNKLALTTPTIASQVLNGNLSNFFRENSYGQTYLSGDVFGWYTIPLNSTECNLDKVKSMADQAAINEGKDLSSYQHKIYVYEGEKNTTGNCGGFAGLATVGDGISPQWAAINGSYYFVNDYSTTAHEIGHNLGLFHSRSLSNCDGDKSALGICGISEYGDKFDTMGWGKGAHFNAFQKERLGWLNTAGTPTVKTVTVAGDYDIEVYSAQTLGVKALKLLREVNPVTGRNVYFYLENRQPVGFDSALNPFSLGDYSKGAVLRMGLEGDPEGTYLIYAMAGDPKTQNVNYVDPNRTVIPVGRYFSDAVSGWMIETISSSTSGLRVRISKKHPPILQIAAKNNVNVIRAQPGAMVIVPASVTAGDAAISKLQFIVSGSVVCESAVSPFTCSVMAPLLANSSIAVQAIATDTLGVQSQPNFFKISTDVIAPTLSITAPAIGATATPGASVSILGEYFDNLAMDRIEVFMAGHKVYEQKALNIAVPTTGNLASFYLPSYIANATYPIRMNVYDEAGNMTSVDRSIQVGTGGTPVLILPTITLGGNLTAAMIEPYSFMSEQNSANFTVNVNPGGDGINYNYFTIKDNAYVGRYVASASGEKFKLSFAAAEIGYSYSHGPASSVDVTVGKIDRTDRTLPVVAITSPADGATLTPLSYVNITATASDNDAVARVDFYVGGALICTTNYDYSCTWAVPRTKGKSYIIEAQAFDKTGNVAKKQITVNTGVATGGKRK